ncbi:MAG: threonine/serine dehydratase [Synergistales bacterium]
MVESISPAVTDILLAYRFLKGKVRHTPIEFSYPLSEELGSKVFLKWENQQHCASFKIRGAMNRMYALTCEERTRGVVTASSGNHAQGVATAAALLQVRAVICVPGMCPETKKTAIRRRGGDWVDLRVIGHFYDEAEDEAKRLAAVEGMTFVSAYEDFHVVCGQGTVAVEMLLDEPDLDVLVVPISGGGLISGISAAALALKPGIEIWGIHAEANPSWSRGWKEGRIVPVEEEDTLADALSGAASQVLYEYLRPCLKGVVPVSERAMATAVAFLHREHHQVVEGSGAIGVAALLDHLLEVRGKKVGVVVSGGNIDEGRLLKILEENRK